MKCPNCNAGNAEGMKFCGECGTKLPEPMNHCPTCNKDWPINMKFCGECGFKFGGGSAAGTSIGSGAIALGDKNVISGDLVSNVSTVNNTSNVDNSNTTVNTTNNTTNTTTVINSDETKKVKKCHCCGKLITITEGFDCPECGEFTCSNCYDIEKKLCKTCLEKKQTVKTAQNAKFMDFLTTTEELDLKKAVELFYEEGKYLEAYNLAFPVWEKHKTDETVQDTFWQIAVKFAQKTRELMQGFGDDIPFYIGVACTLYFIRANEFDMAERRIKAAKQVEDDEGKFSMNIRYNEFLLNLALFKKYNDKSFLETAEKIMADEFTERSDKLENSWKIVLLNELNKCKGEEPMTFEKDFCKENKLYYDFVNSDVFAFGINTSMDFVTVEGGTYIMGNEQTPAECRLKATVGDMYVCKHPVTQKEYSYIMGKDSCSVNSSGEFPVTYITWYDAIEYCNKRSEKEGLASYYNIDKEHKAEGDKFDKICWNITENNDSDGYRLPTQEEWEYVARGGKVSKGYKFAGSNVLAEVAFTGLDFNKCPEICQKKPNELGIYDMGGLVSEFCYPRRIIQFKDGTTQFRIRAKGNSYVEIPNERFAGYREDHWYVAKGIESDGGDYPYSKYEFYGFRVVRSKLK